MVAMILLLADVLKPVNVPSLALHSSDINFMDVDSKVKAACNELECFIEHAQAHQQDMFFSKAQQLFEECDERTNLCRRMRKENQMEPDVFLQTTGITFINSLNGEIVDAFVCHPVFTAFRALDPRYLPDTPAELLDHRQVNYCKLL